MATPIPMLDAVVTDQHHRILLYGPAGSGKTTLIKGFPKPIALFDFDQKYEPLMGMDGIDVYSYPLADVGKASLLFHEFQRDWKKIAFKDNKYATVVLDSLTGYDTINLRHFVMLSGKTPDSKATLPVYGDQSGWYSYFFTEARAIPKHLVVIAHEYIREDEGEKTTVQPLVTGRMILNKLPAMFKEVWYVKRNKNSVKLHYHPIQRALANSLLLHGDSGYIENPTYDKIMQHIKNGEKKS